MSTQILGLVCPSCRVALVMSERQGIEIDYCPQCRGVWLDRGELDKIIERSGREAAAAAPPPPQQAAQQPYRGQERDHRDRDYDDGRSHGQYRKRKKSFFEELFD
ncbi:zf-TFIIB domain-containing protein [Mesorhizobium sp. LHD-90]|uniref:TFIIB-type zinc ribbon-containing protein n=1 Tax=Mesorhizobium sp. LHD-90 TaxID=3071414 RepID=UPI0027E0D2EA|nr:zf-TFIIB domain-containing protein [Mesorhizobium sp. LHD-90]MDQ6433607.1 zf-TFIIB domain-containing protein [Mesorhizobium sp. LHD-90]